MKILEVEHDGSFAISLGGVVLGSKTKLKESMYGRYIYLHLP